MVRSFSSKSFMTLCLTFYRSQFANRDSLSYMHQEDSILTVTCKITTSPSTPPLRANFDRLPVPKQLIDTFGALLDDPLYSDVEFLLPRPGHDLIDARRILASRRLLTRAEYFNSSKYWHGLSDSRLFIKLRSSV